MRASRLLVALLFFAQGLAAAPLPDFEASYRLEQHDLRIGTATLALQVEPDGRYRYEFRSWPKGWVSWFSDRQLVESSHGILGDTGIRPEQYHYRRSGDHRRDAHLSFDREALSVTNDVAGSRWQMPITADTVDKLATQLGMMLALAAGHTDVTFPVADGGALKQYRYRVIAHETLDLPAGTFRTVKVAKLREDIDQEVIIWFAPELHHLPVRIWRRDSDIEEYVSELESFSRSLWGKISTPREDR